MKKRTATRKTLKPTSVRIDQFFNTNPTATKRSYKKMVDESKEISIEDVEHELIQPKMKKVKLFDEAMIKKSLEEFKNNGDSSKIINTLANACLSLVHAQTQIVDNCHIISASTDKNTEQTSSLIDQVMDGVSNAQNALCNYIDENENDKLVMKVKMDVRHNKQFLTIHCLDDLHLPNINESNVGLEVEKIFNAYNLDLKKAYITKAYTLTGLKRINNQQKFVKYIMVQFSDNATSERLVSEMIKQNKSNASKNPKHIFGIPSSYDMRKVFNVCNDLRQKGLIDQVNYGDDSIKVTLPKLNGEKQKPVHVRGYKDLDKLRLNINDPNSHFPTRTFYNKDYWKDKYAKINTNNNNTYFYNNSCNSRTQRGETNTKILHNRQQSQINENNNKQMNSGRNSKRLGSYENEDSTVALKKTRNETQMNDNASSEENSQEQ